MSFRERIDMAVFGAVPAFVRASVRLSGLAPDRGAHAARALVQRAGLAALPAEDDARLAAWREAYASVGLGPDVIPPPAALADWAVTPGGVPSQGALRDLVHAFSLRHVVPIAAYDLAAIAGDLWLCPSRGCEHFVGMGEDGPTSPELNELILVDSRAEVLARHWHGRQGRLTAACPGTRDALVHLDFLTPLADRSDELTGAFVRLATGFVGGTAEVRWLRWETPQVDWTVGRAAGDDGD